MKKFPYQFNFVLCGIFLLLSALAVFGQSVETAFTEANHLFEQQRYSEAAAAYEKIIADGKISAPLLFNLGNAQFKSGQVGRAIAAFRHAQKLAPRDPDIRANLQFARDQVQNAKPLPTNAWKQFLSRFTLNEWAVFAAILVWLWFVLLAVPQWNRNLSRMLRPSTIVVAVLACLTIACTVVAAQQKSAKIGVIVTDEAVVRRGPFAESQSAYSLRDGAELIVLDQRENWVQVADAGNRIGWVPRQQVVVVP